ncbi:MAG: DUF2062 domain-containing protein [Betaproteobacteria bacterium]|nr:DUF2062 domain-containing protein [Betaproteobacteria bacterium]
MPRKYFRRFLPSHESVKQHRYVAVFGTLLHHPNLWHLNHHSVAGGVAVGLVSGLVPGSNPVQFLLAAIFSIVFKVNLPVAVIVTLYTNPFTIVPIYFVAYKLGSLVTGQANNPPPHAEFSLAGRSVGEWLPALIDWLTSIGKPLLAGLPLLALILATTGYFAVRWAWRLHVMYSWHKRKARRRAQSAPPTEP